MFTQKPSTSVFASMVFTVVICIGGAGAQELATPLDLAFEAVSKMPLRPHIKTRSRVQADLVQAAVQAGQIEDAVAWAARIENWRRGLALGHVAVHHARTGNKVATLEAIANAEAFETTIVAEEDQGWRRDRVRVRIAEAYALIGEPAKAAQIQAAVAASEGGRLAALAVRSAPDADIGKQLTTLEAIAKTGDLEQARFSLMAMTELYRRALKQPKGADSLLSPDGIEKRIKASWSELPIEPRIDIVERLIHFDVECGEAAEKRASAHVGEILGLVVNHRWNPEQAIALRARVAGLYASIERHEAGRAMANDALARYEAARESIVDIYRGEALCPLAEALVALGDPVTATKVYERALEESLENPNSRPRAADLAMVVISLCSLDADYEAPKTLLLALERASQAIGAPW